MKLLALSAVVAALATTLVQAEPVATSGLSQTGCSTRTTTISSVKSSSKPTTIITSTKKKSSTTKSSTSSISRAPKPTACTGEQASNGMVNAYFEDGLKNWTAKSNSSLPNAFGTSKDLSAPDGDNVTAFLSFPKGKVTTASLSQVITACAGYVEGFGFSYRLAKGSGCRLNASVPPADFTPVDLVASKDWDNKLTSYQDYGPNQERGSVVHVPFTVTVTCSGREESLVRLDYFNFGGIG